jgi:hypothetical protein
MKSFWFRILPLAVLFATSTPGVAQETPPAKPVVMTAELMQRLVIFAQDQETHTIPGTIGKMFGLCDGTKDLPMKTLETERPAGTYFAVSLDAEHKDIVVLRRLADGGLEAYLTNQIGKLRAAGVDDGHGARLLPASENVTAIFEAALNQLAREAAEDLPPTHPDPVPALPAK